MRRFALVIPALVVLTGCGLYFGNGDDDSLLHGNNSNNNNNSIAGSGRHGAAVLPSSSRMTHAASPTS